MLIGEVSRRSGIPAPTIRFYEEQQLVIKTTRALLPALRSRIAAMHPHDLPELLVLAVEDGAPAYLEWVRREAGHTPTG